MKALKEALQNTVDILGYPSLKCYSSEIVIKKKLR
jgi:hypothetical protein